MESTLPVTDRACEFLLAAAAESGALQVFALWYELAEHAGNAEFTGTDAVRDALTPQNKRLRDAIEAACGNLDPRKLGKLLAKWEGKNVGSLRAHRIGDDPAGILWKVSRVETHSRADDDGERCVNGRIATQGCDE